MEETSDKSTQGDDSSQEESQDTNTRKKVKHLTHADLFERQRGFATQFFTAQDFVTRATSTPALDIAAQISKQIVDYTPPISNFIESLELSTSVSETFTKAIASLSKATVDSYKDIFKCVYSQDNWSAAIGESIAPSLTLTHQFSQIIDQLKDQNQAQLQRVVASLDIGRSPFETSIRESFDLDALARIGSILDLSVSRSHLLDHYIKAPPVYEINYTNPPSIQHPPSTKRRKKASSSKDTDERTKRRWENISKMREHINMEDLEAICFTANICFDELGKGGITVLICRAIGYAKRRGRLKQFNTAYRLVTGINLDQEQTHN
jgi:hypothetical protein